MVSISRKYIASIFNKYYPYAYVKCKINNGNVIECLSTPLDVHLGNVGKAIKIFTRRLKVIATRTRDYFGWNFNEFEEFIYTIGAFHDLGKTSIQYLDKFSEKKDIIKSSFPEHEYIISLIIGYASLRKSNVILKRRLKLLAKIIARHHSAMINRHPIQRRRYLHDPKLKRTYISLIIKTIKLLKPKVIEDLCAKLCKSNMVCREIYAAIYDALKDIIENGMTKTYIEPLYELLVGFESLEELILTNALTGALIVADTLCAEEERRESDDELSPIYAKYWRREIMFSRNFLNEYNKT